MRPAGHDAKTEAEARHVRKQLIEYKHQNKDIVYSFLSSYFIVFIYRSSTSVGNSFN